MEKILVVDANARLKGKRLATLDVIGVGPRLVTALLKYYGFDATLQPYENVVDNKELVKEFDVLAVSFMVSDAIAVKKLVSVWRKTKDGRGTVALGGPGVLDPRALSLIDFDIAFLGEAEVIFYTLFRQLNYSSFSEILDSLRSRGTALAGLAIKRGSEVVYGELAPWASRDLLFKVIPEVDDIRNYPFYWACRVYVEVVRGCSNFRRPLLTSSGKKCIDCSLCRSGKLSKRISCPIGIPPGCGYCSVPLIHGYPRSRDAYSIAEEIRRLLEIGATRIVLSASDFLDYGRDHLVNEPLTDPCNPPPNIDAIEKLLKMVTSFEAVLEGRASILVENVKACLVNEYVAELLGRYLKGTAIYIGLESCSDKVLEVVGRPNTCADVLKAIELLSRYKLRPYVYLMHGIPIESTEDIDKTIQIVPQLEKLGVERIVLYKFRPLPRTAFDKIRKRRDPEYLEYVEKLKNIVREFNEYVKTKLTERILDVVIASEYPKNRSYLVAYPLHHGPVVLLRISRKFIGCIARVRITKVLSDRVVLGTLIYTKHRVAL